jgi:3-oxoacyl-(acyl-carrier-protein) synthase
MKTLQEVVVTGMGAITTFGDATFADDTTLHPPPRTGAASLPAEHFELKNYPLSPKTYLDRCSALALAGGAIALRDAGVTAPVSGAERFGIVLGTHLGCLATMKGFWDKAMEKGARLANPLLFSHSYFNSPISLCAIEWGLKGYHTTLCAGERSGLEAVRTAFDAIRLGHTDAMLCGGVDALTPERLLMEPQTKDVPPGEASVFFVLESTEHAAAREAANQRPLPADFFEALTHPQHEIVQTFGQCGGATGALAVARKLTQSK